MKSELKWDLRRGRADGVVVVVGATRVGDKEQASGQYKWMEKKNGVLKAGRTTILMKSGS